MRRVRIPSESLTRLRPKKFFAKPYPIRQPADVEESILFPSHLIVGDPLDQRVGIVSVRQSQSPERDLIARNPGQNGYCKPANKRKQEGELAHSRFPPENETNAHQCTPIAEIKIGGP